MFENYQEFLAKVDYTADEHEDVEEEEDEDHCEKWV